MDFTAFLGSNFAGQVGAGLGKGLGDAIGGGSAPMVSGGQVDARSFMDGSGWTVSTGSSKASGATLQGREGFGAGLTQAGLGGGNPLYLLLMLGMGYALWRAR